MRVSSEPDDPGYIAFALMGGRANVYLDGQPLKYCVAADDVEGWAIVTKTDYNGELMHDGEEWVRETLRGKVVIEPIRNGQ